MGRTVLMRIDRALSEKGEHLAPRSNGAVVENRSLKSHSDLGRQQEEAVAPATCSTVETNSWISLSGVRA
eukprot:6268879-Heterocapsa_arctica.AAC.1